MDKFHGYTVNSQLVLVYLHPNMHSKAAVKDETKFRASVNLFDLSARATFKEWNHSQPRNCDLLSNQTIHTRTPNHPPHVHYNRSPLRTAWTQD